MNKKELKQICEKEIQQSMLGWDFSHLKGRWKDEVLPWDYKQIINAYRKDTMKLLDMGTGGGEFLLSLHHPYELVAVTEGYEPNVKLCEKRLSPLGICVKQTSDNKIIPYDDASFDIIINRHMSYDIQEVYRTLKTNGLFITQQVGAYNDMDLSNRLHVKRDVVDETTDILYHAIRYAQETNFDIKLAYEAFTPIQFYDIGALVYFAHIIEWEFMDFHIDTQLPYLYDMQKEIEKNGYIEGKEHRYLLVVQKKS